MICYTLSDCVLINLKTDSKQKDIINDLLLVFPKANSPHKLVIDNEQKILEVYLSHDCHAIQFWLEQMGLTPSSWELIEIPNMCQLNSKEEIFLTVCSATEDKILIVHNHNGWTKGRYYHKRSLLHNNLSIRVTDRSETIKMLSLSEDNVVQQISEYSKDLIKPIINQTTVGIHNSIIAINGSNINDAKIESNE